MSNRNDFKSYHHFKREVLGRNMGSISSTVEDIADDMYQPRSSSEEFDSLWDSFDAEED